MWELFIALFGGAYLASKASSDKRRTRAAIKKIEDDQKKLEIFRKSVTNNEMVSYVNDYMCIDDSGEKIEEELKELFSLIPELNGMEKYWRCYNNSPPAGNWLFIELILCVNRGCVPLTKQFDFTVYPYYIGNNLNGTLIIVYCASSAMTYYVSKGFFDTIPKTLDEAARVDGATRMQVFYKVIMPLSGSIVIYTILLGFMAPWGDFMLASYIIHENSAGMSVAVGMFEWLNKTILNTNYTMFCAAGVVVAIPVTVVFLALQKYYVEGVTGGAVKG